MKNKKIISIICLVIGFLFNAYAAYAMDANIINKEELKEMGKANHGNAGRGIYEDDNAIRWVVNPCFDRSIFVNMENVANTYITSKVLQFLLKSSIVPVVAEIAILNDLSGSASKWVNNFVPLADYGWERFSNDMYRMQPKELDGYPILNREAIILATDFTGTTDRNPGNIGFVIENDQYFAAQVDYDDAFRFDGFETTIFGVLEGKLDAATILKEIEQIIGTPDNWIDDLVDSTKEAFLSAIASLNKEQLYNLELDSTDLKPIFNLENEVIMPDKLYFYIAGEEAIKDFLSKYIVNYLDQVKPELKLQNSLLKEVKKYLILFEDAAEIESQELIFNEYWSNLKGITRGFRSLPENKRLSLEPWSKKLFNLNIKEVKSDVMEAFNENRELLNSEKLTPKVLEKILANKGAANLIHTLGKNIELLNDETTHPSF